MLTINLANKGRSRKANIIHYEIQVLESGEKCDTAYNNCSKQKDHNSFISINELTERLSIEDNDLSSLIFNMCKLTTMIEVPQGNSVRCGTCFVQKIEMITGKSCPCLECKSQKENLKSKTWGKVTLSTALHVIPDESDAQNCTVKLFYDSPDSQGQVKVIYGLKSHSRDVFGDWCALVCVTHETDLLNKLQDLLKEYWKLGHKLKEKYQDSKQNLVVVVSHPHGGPKRVSIGKGNFKDLAREVSDEQDWCYYSYDATTCDGSSGAAVYVLGRWNDGFGYWFGHSHNHSGIDDRYCNGSTIGVFSTYGRLTQTYSSCEIDNVNSTNGIVCYVHKSFENRKSNDCHDEVVFADDQNGNVIKSHLNTNSTEMLSSTNENMTKSSSSIDDNMAEPSSTTDNNMAKSYNSTDGSMTKLYRSPNGSMLESYNRMNGSMTKLYSSTSDGMTKLYSSTSDGMTKLYSSRPTNGNMTELYSSHDGRIIRSHSDGSVVDCMPTPSRHTFLELVGDRSQLMNCLIKIFVEIVRLL